MFKAAHTAEFQSDHDHRCDKRNTVSHRRSEHNAVDAEKQRKDQDERNQENDLTGHREKDTFDRFSDGGKKVGRDELASVDNNHHQENAHKFFGKFKIQLVAAAEQADDLMREKLKQYKADG